VNTPPAIDGFATFTGVGTAIARAVAITNFATRQVRLGYVSAATVGSLCGHLQPQLQFHGGDGTGRGGFHYMMRFIPSDAAAVAGARMFCGLRNLVSAPTNVEPSTLVNCIGIAQLSSSGNLHLVRGGTTAQAAVDLGVNFPAGSLSTDVYEIEIYANPTLLRTYGVKVTRMSDAGNFDYETTISGSTIQVPGEAVLLAPTVWRCNNATALAVGIDVVLHYGETN
jgi:hypothetical protein